MYGSVSRTPPRCRSPIFYMYGGGFDMAAALLHKIIPLELFETAACSAPSSASSGLR